MIRFSPGSGPRGLLQLAADRKRAEVDDRESHFFEDRRHGGFGGGVVPRHEEHPPPDGLPRLGAEERDRQRIPNFHDARPRRERRHDFARRLAAELGEAEVGLDDRIGGIDEDAAVPGGEAGERGGDLRPLHRDHDDLGTRGLLARRGFRARAERSDDAGEGLRPAAIADNHLVPPFAT